MKLKVKRLSDTAKLPFRATPYAAGADLYADLKQPLTLIPGQRAGIPTGIAVEPEEPGYGIFLFARSGLACKHGLTLSNSVGVVDADYRGELIVSLTNLGDAPYTVCPGERIAQLVVMPVEYCDFVESEALSDTERGAGGFGSTGTGK